MNFRTLLYFALMCFGLMESNLQAYPVSMSLWKLPQGQHVLTVGDCHLSIESDSENVGTIKNTADAFKGAEISLSIQLEANLPPTELVGTESADNNVSFKVTDCRGTSYWAFIFWLDYLRDMNVQFHSGDKEYSKEMAKLAPLRDTLKKEALEKPQLKKYLHATKQMLMSEIDQSILRITNKLENNDDRFLNDCLARGVDCCSNIATFFEESADDTSIMDFLFDFCRDNKGIDPVLNSWRVGADKWADNELLTGYAPIVDAGFIMEIQQAIEDDQNVLLYAGFSHIITIDQYLEKTMKAQCVDTIKIEVFKASFGTDQKSLPKIIPAKDFTDFCKKFQESCFKQKSKKRKQEDAGEGTDNKKQNIWRLS